MKKIEEINKRMNSSATPTIFKTTMGPLRSIGTDTY
jgi:hypothetical protein